MDLLLSKVTTPIFGWIVQLLGWVIDGVYIAIDTIGIPNIGLAIILYTIVIYTAMYPLQKKQQKLSKMMSYIQPEISVIQKKYQGRRDQDSMYKMQEETNAVYQKYGTSPYGTCLPLLIQLPLLFALYQVIYHIPGYVERVASIFSSLATKIFSVPGGTTAFANFVNENSIRISVSSSLTKINVVDALYAMTPAQWTVMEKVPQFSQFSSDIAAVAAKSDQVNTFLGLNISESPIESIQNSARAGTWWLIIIAVLIPVLAWFTQWLNVKLQPTQSAAATADQPGGGSMKMMNNIMPLFSAFLCLSLSVGIGIYWIAGAVIRCVQMIYLNRKMMKMDVEAMIRENQEKAALKAKKKGKDTVSQSRVQEATRIQTRRVKDPKGKYTNDTSTGVDYYEANKNAAPNSIMARANMVRKYDETHEAEKKPGKKNKK